MLVYALQLKINEQTTYIGVEVSGISLILLSVVYVGSSRNSGRSNPNKGLTFSRTNSSKLFAPFLIESNKIG